MVTNLPYLHTHPQFNDLIRIVAEQMGIVPVLVEKDYWIMHCLYGLQQQNMTFYMKGGTSLSKGYKIIHRFSEDIDILIEPPEGMNVATGKNQDKEIHRQSRRQFYDWLSKSLKIGGIETISRDPVFDDEKYRSGGIRLTYPTSLEMNKDVKSGILLEVGFDKVAPNSPLAISSWAYDFAADKVEVRDNRAQGVPCYRPGYTLVEKLQTISTKFRKQQETGAFLENFMRHYYDVYHLLNAEDVLEFIGTDSYHRHKSSRFRSGDNPDIQNNPAFHMGNSEMFERYKDQYERSQTLYYKDKPSFEDILDRIQRFSEEL